MQVVGIDKGKRELHCIELDTQPQKVFKDDLQYDEIWLATGSAVGFTCDPLLANIREQCPLKVELIFPFCAVPETKCLLTIIQSSKFVNFLLTDLPL